MHLRSGKTKGSDTISHPNYRPRLTLTARIQPNMSQRARTSLDGRVQTADAHEVQTISSDDERETPSDDELLKPSQIHLAEQRGEQRAEQRAAQQNKRAVQGAETDFDDTNGRLERLRKKRRKFAIEVEAQINLKMQGGEGGLGDIHSLFNTFHDVFGDMNELEDILLKQQESIKKLKKQLNLE